jgi:CheY-like chemotaxis protein
MLAIDESPEVRDFFRRTTDKFGVSCDQASTIEESRALMEKNAPYDLFFVDWKSIGMNIAGLVNLIRERDPGHSVVTMMSAAEWNTFEYDAKKAGLHKFVSKPLFPSDVSNCISEYLGTRHVAEIKNDGNDSFTGYTLLLAEDVEVNREIVISLLEPTELTIDCAKNGAEAVEMFLAAPERYDMIFMDVQMPEMDGYEATRRIRASGVPRAESIPIVAMTANVFREDVERCLESGMNDHVGKPLDFDEVLDKLRKYLTGNDAPNNA